MFKSISEYKNLNREYVNEKNQKLSMTKWEATPDPKTGRKCIACGCMRVEEQLDTEYKLRYCEYCGIQLLYDRYQISMEIAEAMVVAAIVFGIIGTIVFSSFLGGLLSGTLPIFIFISLNRRLTGKFF
jgi:uncharacterized paraquat-inducible protein A